MGVVNVFLSPTTNTPTRCAPSIIAAREASMEDQRRGWVAGAPGQVQMTTNTQVLSSQEDKDVGMDQPGQPPYIYSVGLTILLPALQNLTGASTRCTSAPPLHANSLLE